MHSPRAVGGEVAAGEISSARRPFGAGSALAAPPTLSYMQAMRPDGIRPATVPPRGTARLDVATMSPAEKLAAAMRRSLPHLAPEAQEAVARLVTPENMKLLAEGTAVWAAAHAVGVGEAADLVALGIGAASLGGDAVGVAQDLLAFGRGALGATSLADLETAGTHLAHAVTTAGADAVTSGLLHRGAAVGPDLDLAGARAAAQSGLHPALARRPSTRFGSALQPQEVTLANRLEARRLAEPPPPPAPRRTLANHEQAGGHVILLHVGQSVAALQERFKEYKNMEAASSFYRRPDAERMMTQVLGDRTNQRKITAWLASGRPTTELLFEGRSRTRIGRVMLRSGERFQIVESHTARVVLKPTAEAPGWYIHTAFPIKDRR